MAEPVIAVPWIRPDYRSAIERAGGVVRELDPHLDHVEQALGECDGVLLTGGVDVDPMEYGERTRHPSVEIDATRDRYELALARASLARDMPLLAICRGAQVLNVAAGGTLWQDIPSQQPSPLQHTVSEPRDAIAHEVIVTPGSCLAAVVHPRADGTLAVNSRHHQAVRALAPGFVASAHAPDGIIDAIERPGARFCIAVQWHPENFWRTGDFGSLFGGFVGACRKL